MNGLRGNGSWNEGKMENGMGMPGIRVGVRRMRGIEVEMEVGMRGIGVEMYESQWECAECRKSRSECRKWSRDEGNHVTLRGKLCKNKGKGAE